MRIIGSIAAAILIFRWAYKMGAKNAIEAINKQDDPVEATMTNEWSSRNKDQWNS